MTTQPQLENLIDIEEQYQVATYKNYLSSSSAVTMTVVFAAFRDWNDMIDRKENILPGFIGVAILTQKVGALTNLRLNRGGEFMGHRLPLEPFEIARDCG